MKGLLKVGSKFINVHHVAWVETNGSGVTLHMAVTDPDPEMITSAIGITRLAGHARLEFSGEEAEAVWAQLGNWRPMGPDGRVRASGWSKSTPWVSGPHRQ